MHREAGKHQGAMHAIIGLPIEDVAELVDRVPKDGIVSVANHNTQHQIVITGTPSAVEQVSSMAVANGAKSRALKVSGAWHSELIKGAQAEFQEFLGTIGFDAPQKQVIHNVTAAPEENPDEIRNIMARQLCSPVRWYDTMNKLMEQEVEVFVEVGPGRVLAGLLKKTLPADYPGQFYNVANMKQLEKLLKAL
jgi:[acyl-carrier-protein] S-malonyltransferase